MTSSETTAVRVLLVDEYRDMAELTAENLEAEDNRFAVDVVTSVEEALTRLEETEYECLVSDYEMPTMTGLEFLDIIRDRHSDLPFILVTARGSEAVASDAISAGVTDYIRKDSDGVQEAKLANRILNVVERRRARRDQRAMHERMELALEATDSIVFEVNFEFETVRRHGAFEEFFGVSPAEVPTLEAYADRIVHPSDHEGFMDFFAGLRIGEHESGTHEYRTHPDLGDVRWIRARARLDEDGTRALGLAQDITDEKDRTRELELAETVFEQTQDAIFLVDVVDGDEFCIERVNPAYEEATGFAAAKLQGKSPREAVGEAVGSDIEARYRECLEQQESMEYEETIPVDEETRYWRTHLAPVIEHGEVVKLVGATRDVTERRKRERRYNAIFNQTYQFTGLLDPDGTLIEANETALEFGGLERDEVVGKKMWEAAWFQHSQEIKERAREAVERAADGQFVRHELTVQGADSKVVIDFSIRPVRDGQGDVTLLIPEGRDITERKERERELRRLSQEYQAVFENAQDSLFLLDVDRTDSDGDPSFRFRQLNPANRAALGLEDTEMQGKTPREVFGVELAAELRTNYQQCLDAGETISYEEELSPVGNSETRVFETTLSPVEIDDERTQIVGVAHDITERREREQQLERERDRLAAAFDAVPYPFVRGKIEEEGPVVQRINDAFEDVFGYSASEIVGNPLGEFIVPEEHAETARSITEQVRTDGAAEREIVRQTADGEWRNFLFRIASFTRPDGTLEGVGAYIDITERKERVEKLQWYEGIVETTRDTAAVLDEDGRFEIVNSRLAEIYGKSPDQLRGERSRLVETVADQNGDTDPYGELIEGDRKEFRAEIDLEYLSHEDRIADIRMTRLTDDGAFRGVVAVGRDISDRKEYERRLAALNESTNEFAATTTTAEATEYIVTAMADVAGLPNAAVFLYDDDAGVLVPAAQSEDGTQLIEDPPNIGPGEGVAWRAFASGETVRYDDIREAEDVYNPQTPIRSELIVPLGEHGVLIAGDPRPRVFDDRNQEFAEIIAGAAEATLDSVTQTERLRERTRELDRRTRRLDRVNQLNDAVRRINRVIVDADSRELIAETVCERIAGLDHIAFAWIGEPSPDPGTLSLWAWGGTNRSYLDMREFPLDEGTGSEPAREAAQTGENVYIPNIVRADHTGQWQTAALQQGYKSVLSVPLAYEDSLFGVLTIYAETQDSFDDGFREVLAELGDLVGLGLNALDRRDALLGRRHTTVKLGLTDESAHDDPFLQLADRLDCTVEVSRMLPREEESLVYAACTGVTQHEVDETVAQLPGIASVRRVQGTDPCETEPCLFEFLTTEQGFMSQLAGRGVQSHMVTFERGRARIVATVPSTIDPSALVGDLTVDWPGLTLEATEIQREQQDVSNAFLLTTDLTTAQQEAVEAAYEAGFFEWPRDSTSEEVATALGISQPAFAQRLRAAQGKIFEAYCRWPDR